MNQFNKVLTNTGDETGLFTNLMYNIRNQNFNGDNEDNANYLNHRNTAYVDGKHYAEICAQQGGSEWFFQDTGQKMGTIPLYYIRSQDFNGEQWDNANYLNHRNTAYVDGKHYAEICAQQGGSEWFFQDTGQKMGTIPLYYIRSQDFNGTQWDNANYLNHKNKAWTDGKYRAEICAQQDGSEWFFEVDKSSYALQVSVLNMSLNTDESMDKLLSSTSLGTHTVNNANGNSPLTASLDFTKSFTSSISYTYSVSVEVGIQVKVSFKESAIFESAGIDITGDLKRTESSSFTHTNTTTSTLSLTESVTVDPGKCSDITGYYKIIQANQVAFKTTALVSITGTIIDEHGNIVTGQNIPNAEFITQYINDNIKGMTVIASNYSDTNVKVEMTGYMSANLATMDSYSQEVACDGNNFPEHTEL